VKAAYKNVAYDLGVNARYGALVAGYEVGWSGGEPGEIEPKVIDLLNERISRGFDYRVVKVNVPHVNDGACEIEFSEDGSYSVDLALDGSVTHVAGGVRASGFEVGEELSPRWKLLYDLVHAEHPEVLLVAATALAYNEDVQAALDAREAELNVRYSDKDVVWELRWDGSKVETIARDAKAGPIVPVNGKLELMPYRLTTGEAELPEVEVPEPEPKPTPAPAPRPRPQPPREPNPDFTISIYPPIQTVVAGESTRYTVTVTSVDGYSGAISLSVSGLPGGSSAILDPATIELQANGSRSSTLMVSTKDSTPAGTYTLTVTGRGDLTKSASARLKVIFVGDIEPGFWLVPHDAWTLPGAYAAVEVYVDDEGRVLPGGQFIGPEFWRGWTPGASTWPGAEEYFRSRGEPQPIVDTGPWLD
jgi:hypothetical protein